MPGIRDDAPRGTAVDALFAGLNPAQRDAVVHRDGPLLVLAGAGSGKTRVITHRIAHRIAQGVRPWRITAMTFTNKAAREMRARAVALAGEAATQSRISTFHSTCARLLRRYAPVVGRTSAFSIFDEDDQLALLRDVAESMGNVATDAQALRDVRGFIESAHHAALTPDEVHEAARSPRDEERAEIFEAYAAALRANNALDFGTLVAGLVHACDESEDVAWELRQHIDVLVVDEFQDTNVAQYRLLKHLTPASGDVTVVGDDDQAIYGWRGATVENVHAFSRDNACTVIALEQNYRSGPVILDAAYAIVSRIEGRMEKRLRTDRDDRVPVIAFVGNDDAEEADFIARTIERERIARGIRYEQIAVFFRTNAQSRILEERLRRAGIHHEVVGSTAFFARREVKDALAYLRIAANPSDDVAVARVINVPSRGIGKTTLARVRRHRDAEALRSLADAGRDLLQRGSAIRGRGRAGLESFLALHAQLTAASHHASPGELLETILTETGYLDYIEKLDESGPDRRENVEELLRMAQEFGEGAAASGAEGIAGFLESVSLREQESSDDGGDRSRVPLMTVHASKGLEFPVVFVSGLEQGTFPLQRKDRPAEPGAEDEERRLCYVAFTRAEQQLYVCAARRRRLYGRWLQTEPSTYLTELPDEVVTMSPESSSPRDWSKATPRVRERGGPRFDEFDQRSWQERMESGVGEAVPEEGLVFDDSHYPSAVFDEAASHVGQRVRHKSFGVGQVVDAERTSGKTRLTIEFPEVGLKKVVSTYVEFLDA